MHPALLLADEPTGNLDRSTGEDVMRLLEDLQARGTTLVVVTHDAALGDRAHRQLYLEDGEIRRDTRREAAVPA
jgi:putative ABC transport system ATP-binding protein